MQDAFQQAHLQALWGGQATVRPCVEAEGKGGAQKYTRQAARPLPLLHLSAAPPAPAAVPSAAAAGTSAAGSSQRLGKRKRPGSGTAQPAAGSVQGDGQQQQHQQQQRAKKQRNDQESEPDSVELGVPGEPQQMALLQLQQEQEQLREQLQQQKRPQRQQRPSSSNSVLSARGRAGAWGRWGKQQQPVAGPLDSAPADAGQHRAPLPDPAPAAAAVDSSNGKQRKLGPKAQKRSIAERARAAKALKRQQQQQQQQQAPTASADSVQDGAYMDGAAAAAVAGSGVEDHQLKYTAHLQAFWGAHTTVRSLC